MKKIYQVLGKLNYDDVNYIIDNEEYENYKLSSEVLLRHYNYDKIVLVCPISIDEKDEKIVEVLPKSKDKIEILHVHAIGRYNNKEYKSSPVNISLQIFTYMLSNNDDEIIIDISTGYNLYTFALIEAARFFSTFNRLKDKIIYRTNLNKEYAKVAICEPVIKESNNIPNQIFVESLKVHSFFSLPIKCLNNYKLRNHIDSRGLTDDTSKEIDMKYNLLNKEIKKVLENAIMAYNAIRYNTPLAFSILKLDDEQEIIKLLSNLNDFCNKILTIKKDNNKIYMERSIYDLYLSLAIYYSIIQNIKEIKTKSLNNTIETLDDLKNFMELYNLLELNLNSLFLDRDLNEIEYKSSSLNDKEVLLKQIYSSDDNKENTMPKSGNEKRNFFAHSGLESTLCKIYKKDGKIYIKYIEEKINFIKKWLLDP